MVGVITPVVVKGDAKLLANEVTVGNPTMPDEGAKTITPGKGVPGFPSESVGVIRPVVVKGETTLPANEVTVGRPAAPDEGWPMLPNGGWLPLPSGGWLTLPCGGWLTPPDVGTTTITPLYRAAVVMPAAFVGVIIPKVVNAELPEV